MSLDRSLDRIPSDARRILLYGVTGSGKSTMAARLSTIVGIPWHSVDDLTWEPGWVAVPTEEQRRRIAMICAEPEWILDTAYGEWLDVALSRAQCVVALDYPRWLSFQRLVRRTVARLVDKQPICNGNRETIRGTVSRNSILLWHNRSFARKRERIRSWSADESAPPLVRLTSPRQAKAWLSRERNTVVRLSGTP